MPDTSIFLFPVLLPLIAAVLAGLWRKRPAILSAWLLGAVIVSVLGSLGTLTGASAAYEIAWVADFKIALAVDGFRSLLLGFIALFMVLNAVYMLRFLPKVKRPWLYVSFALVAYASANAVVMSKNILVLLIGWELFLAALYGMILSGGEQAEPVAFKALMIGGASDFLMILGLMLYLGLGGALSMDGTALATDASLGAFASFILLFLGAGAKAGMWPFQTWIPSAAERMPAPAFAALPASLEKILGITMLFTLVKSMFTLGPVAQTVVMTFGVITVFAAVIPALVEKNFRKVLAFTAISPVGFMLAGLATGVAAGMAGALMYMLTHAVYKSAMFYAAGNLEAETLEAIQERPKRHALSVIGYIGAFLAAISFPFTGGFLAKEAILDGVAHHHFYVLFVLLVAGAALNVAVMVKLLRVLTWRWREKEAGEAPLLQTIPVLTLGGLAVVGGLVFLAAGHRFDVITGGDVHSLIHHGLTAPHGSPLIIASGAIWLLGLSFAFAGKLDENTPAQTFDRLRHNAMLGHGYDLAEAGRLDAYEVLLRVIQATAFGVFTYVERSIDRAGLGLIRVGQVIGQGALSGIHNGLFSNYLAWVLAGFALVAAMVLLR